MSMGADGAVIGEETLQVVLARVVVEVAAGDRPHRVASSSRKSRLATAPDTRAPKPLLSPLGAASLHK